MKIALLYYCYIVSTHSRLKAAGMVYEGKQIKGRFQHTAA